MTILTSRHGSHQRWTMMSLEDLFDLLVMCRKRTATMGCVDSSREWWLCVTRAQTDIH